MNKTLAALVLGAAAALSGCIREAPVIAQTALPLSEQRSAVGTQNIPETGNRAALPTERQFSGEIYAASASACNNQPYVLFWENEYSIICGRFVFQHICDESCSDNLAKYYYSAGLHSGKEEWIDENADGNVEEWRVWTYWTGYSWSGGPVQVIDSRVPPSSLDQALYERYLRRRIGKEKVEAKWEEWKNPGAIL